MRKPGSTYRLQVHAGFGFDQAAAIADYLKDLGVTHVYCSPYLQAAPGSTHGYDVVDHSQVNQELGGAPAHERFVARLRQLSLGQVLDIVPNHMAISGRRNAWWWDVLENGPSSLYANYFDIDWQAPEEKLRNKVQAPVLGDHYGRILTAGGIQAVREGGSFLIRYYEYEFPAAPRALCELLQAASETCRSDMLAYLASSFSQLPHSTSTELAARITRHRNKEVLRGLLEDLLRADESAARAVDAEVSKLNREADALHAFLERQNYRLSYWRTAGRDLGYRRFFDINSLVGLRSEILPVFEDTHRLVLNWVREGVLDGLRVDHPDGLRDPEQYFARLHEAAPGAWIVAEKILEPGERLPSNWAAAGTTGYDFLNAMGGLLIDPRGEEPLTRFYNEFTGEHAGYAEVAFEKKYFVLREILGSDVNRLTAQFLDLCERHRDQRDYVRHDIHHALREVIAGFPVYRTYVRAETGQSSPEDKRRIREAIACAKARRPDLDAGLFDFLQSVLLLEIRGHLEAEFAMQFQQFTGPAMAKGIEDTAFYCYNRLVALNEVGGDPGRFGVSPSEFHAFCHDLQSDWPDTMLASSTHDTKRSEDVRARLSLLSEMPEQWSEAVARWSAHAGQYKRDGWPDRNTEYLLYQTLVGAWPIGPERLAPYMEKAARESKRLTSWTHTNEAFEGALQEFCQALLADSQFSGDLESFVRPLIAPGRVNALALTLLKLTAPGIPDTYQGSEIWDLSLVDPDNRRPVDYECRRKLLHELDHLSPEEIWARADDGLPKLWTIRQGLRARGEWSEYQPLEASGGKAGHVVAFSRGNALCVVPRLVWGLHGEWEDTVLELPPGAWRNKLTGDLAGPGTVPLRELLGRFPVALLVKK